MRLVWLSIATIVLTASLAAQAGQTTSKPASPKAPPENAAAKDAKATVGESASQPTTGKEKAAAEKAVAREAAVDPQAVAALAALRKALSELEGYGKAASRPVTKVRRSEKRAPAKAFLRFVAKQLGKMDAPSPEPDAAQVTRVAEQLSELTTTFVSFADKGLGAAKQAVAGAKGSFEKEAMEELHRQLFTQIVLDNIAEYDGSGTFDGMYAKSESFGKKEAADAFLRVYLDLDQTMGTRSLAGEGVAQLGSKEHIEAVKAVYEDPFEERNIKEKAKEIMARLGDMTLINKDLEGLVANLKEESEKLAKLEAEMAALQEQAQAASSPDATEEQKAGLKELQETIQKKQREMVEAIFRVGMIHNQIAFVYQAVRLNAKTEDSYRKCLDHWLRIGNLLFRDPNHRSRVAITWYNLACVTSLQNKIDDAYPAMENCFKWGYNRFDWVATDGDLTNLRKAKGKELEALIEEVKSGEAEKRWRREAEERNKKAAPPAGESSGDDSSKPDGDS
jgi:uncharacterized protein YdhG (YjbR/CyaY superfamily)